MQLDPAAVADFGRMLDAIHPAGRITLHAWLGDVVHALRIGDYDEASRLLHAINAKAALELGWRANDLGVPAADITRRAAIGDISGAAALLRRMEAQ